MKKKRERSKRRKNMIFKVSFNIIYINFIIRRPRNGDAERTVVYFYLI